MTMNNIQLTVDRRNIGEIGNYYGCISIRRESDKCFWAIEDWGDFSEQEIPKYLFNALTKFQDEQDEQDELNNQQTKD